MVDGYRRRWTEVPDDQLRQFPYSSICEIYGIVGETKVSSGTGWLGPAGKIVTAAHLFVEARSCVMRWADGKDWQILDRVELHSLFASGNGELRKGSPFDLARILVPESGRRRLQPKPLAGVRVEAAGFQAGRLVRHSSAAKRVLPFLGHEAETDNGHSGCPILSDGHVVGVHVGPAKVSHCHMKEALRAQLSMLNSAICCEGQALGFIST